ncbi:MAG: GTP cyclohydrolase I FolE [bacterium]|nr:GTP cyclohydrolase I FolE [bacterium]MCY3652587.1 GTP cyclohydrolase I FolE [bacterium]MDE0643840.1 GTP cyclohydrolase I FolE [bacterium]
MPNPGIDQEAIQVAVRQILEAIGEDPDREGLAETPVRVARMYAEVFDGMRSDPREHLYQVFVVDQHEEMVLVRDIPFYSMCEHHLVPFYGTAHVAYLPAGRVTGLSKLARLVDGFARRPQMQERLTTQIADALVEVMEPRGALVVIEARHLCMEMRGVEKPGAVTQTSAVRGWFRRSAATRAEAFALINRARN